MQLNQIIMQLNQSQLNFLARYFGDLSKILFASIVIGFFVPGEAMLVTTPVFITGSSLAAAFVFISINLLK